MAASTAETAAPVERLRDPRRHLPLPSAAPSTVTTATTTITTPMLERTTAATTTATTTTAATIRAPAITSAAKDPRTGHRADQIDQPRV